MMLFRRTRYLLSAPIIAALLGVSLSSCSAISSSAKSLLKKEPRSSLTNAPGNDGPLLAVKIDDTNLAHPQVGIAQADVVYVEQVEAGLTRLLAIFSSRIPEKIGPIRSVRISDIDLLAQYGRVGFAYSGAQTKMRPVVAAANLIDLGAERNPPTIYTRDESRVSPVNMILLAPELLAKALAKYPDQIARAKNMGWTFGTKPADGRAIESIRISWPNASYEARWSETDKRWLLWHNGNPNVDEQGVHLGSPTVVIQNVTISPSIYGDKFGGVTPLSQTIGSGTGYLLRNGEIFDVRWSRPSAESGTAWTLSDGTSPANFSTGQIWFMLTDRQPSVVYRDLPAAKASPGKTK